MNGEDPFSQLPTKPVVSPLLFHLATARVLRRTPARERRGCRQGHPQRGSLDNPLERLTVRLSHIFRNSTPSCSTLHTPRFAKPRSQLSNSSAPCSVSTGPKRSLDPQEDSPEPKRRRTARKRTRPATSVTEAPQSSSGSLASFDDGSELTALRQTLQQVQEDLSALQQDQRQPDDITRAIQHDLDETQPRDTLRFLEEHFTCVL